MARVAAGAFSALPREQWRAALLQFEILSGGGS